MSPAVHQMGPGLYFFERGWLNGNHFAFQTPRVVLLDSGYLPYLEETLSLLAQVGIAPAEVKLLITSHVHCDHVGAHAHIQQASGCPVALSEYCRTVVEQRDGWATWHRYYGQAYRWFATHDTIADGQRLELGELVLEAIAAPGHASGQLCFFAPDTGWLLSADAVWDRDFGVLTTRIEGLDSPFRQRETLRRLARLPVSRVYPGHGSPIADGKAAIEACLQRVEGFIAQPRRIGEDQVRKIMLYFFLMEGPLPPEQVLPGLLKRPFFREVCDQYFAGRSEATCRRFLAELEERSLLVRKDGLLASTLPA